MSDGRSQGATAAECRYGKLLITGRNSDKISWMPGILRAPCTLAVGYYSIGLLGGRHNITHTAFRKSFICRLM